MLKEEKIKGYKINDFIFNDVFCFRKKDGNYSFLLGENGCSIILSNSFVDDIKAKKIDETLKFKLIQHGLAQIDGMKINSNNDNSIYFIIDTTKKCNLNCMYCFRNLTDNREIKKDKLKDICEYINNIAKERSLRHINIQMWGGEPVLALDKIEYVHNFFKEKEIEVRIDIETNGSLITDRIAKKLFEFNVSVGVSIDGLQKHHDFQRKLINDNGSFDLVTKGIQTLQKYYGNNIGIITVITKYNYNDIEKIINYFVNVLKITNMKFNIVKDNPNAEEDSIGLNLKQVKNFANKLYDTIEIYNAMGINVFEGNIMMRQNNLLERSSFSCCISNGCKGGRNLISIDMQGDLYPCEMTDYKDVKIGSIYNNSELSNNKELEKQINKATKNNVFFSEKKNTDCDDCPFYYYCKGGCTSRIFYSKGKMKYDEIECEFNKIIYRKIIDSILRKLK